MSYSAFPVARMPNIQISFDYDTTQSLSNVTCTFNNYLASPSTNSSWIGEQYSSLTINSNSIVVPKKSLVICNIRSYTYPANTGDHTTYFAIFDNNNNRLSTRGEAKQWSAATTSNLRSQYYTTLHSCQTAYAIVEANTTIQFKTISSGSNGIDQSSHALIFQLEP